jgi:Tfp pilus assembly protein PilN
MKAVNLVPSDARRGGGGSSISAHAPTYALLGLLGVAVAFVTVYVLTLNSIADRTAKLTSLQSQVARAQEETARLANYTQFAQLVQDRTQTVRTMADARFAWNKPLDELPQVVPANTSLQSLAAALGSASSSAGGGTGATTGASLLGSASAPSIEIVGCTRTQDDVARLMSRMRLINGVTQVTLGSSQKPGQNGGGVAAAASGAGAGCGSNAPAFDMMLTLTPLPGAAGASGTTGTSPAVAGTASTATPSGTTSAPSTTTSTVPGASPAPATGQTPTTPAATTPTGSAK